VPPSETLPVARTAPKPDPAIVTNVPQPPVPGETVVTCIGTSDTTAEPVLVLSAALVAVMVTFCAAAKTPAASPRC
jgi:hypothetical protein